MGQRSEEPGSFSAGNDHQHVVVLVIETDEVVRNQLIGSLTERGYASKAFESIAAYSRSPPPVQASCVVVDSRLPGLAGSGLHNRMEDPAQPFPLVVITGERDGLIQQVPFVEKGAISTLRKPFRSEDLATAVDRSIRIHEMRQQIQKRFATIEASVEQLSPREKKVLNAIISGQLNKAIAKSLDVSVRTIEGDRAKIVEKFRAETTGEVVGKYAQYQLLTEMGYPTVGSATFVL